jgi:hypothetical protein
VIYARFTGIYLFKKATDVRNEDNITYILMTDTPLNIKELQLKIWLSKSPMERLKQMMEDNASLIRFWMTTRISDTDTSDRSVSIRD